MFDQLEDGSHQISLRKIRCPHGTLHSDTIGELTWSREKGIRFSLTFLGLATIRGSTIAPHVKHEVRGVGRFSEQSFVRPRWIAETDDGTQVRLYGVQEECVREQKTYSGAFEYSTTIEGEAIYAVVEIPSSRLLAFKNSTEEAFRMFFSGGAGMKFHQTKDVEFHNLRDGIRTRTSRCTIRLQHSPKVSLVASDGLVKCRPSGWLGFEKPPVNSEHEIGAYSEQLFVSFLNGKLVPFHWSDQETSPDMIVRTYFGWITQEPLNRDSTYNQPLPFLDGVEALGHAEEVLDHLAEFFGEFTKLCPSLAFAKILYPLWMALEGVFDDQLALASVSLERLGHAWDEERGSILDRLPEKEEVIWKNKELLRPIRQQLLDQLDTSLTDVKDLLTSEEHKELHEVLRSRLENLTGIPNSARLRRPFEELGIVLTQMEKSALLKRNSALHGRTGDDNPSVEQLDEAGEIFDLIRMLITKFILAVCKYDGPYIDYATRPSKGNFLVRRFTSSVGDLD